MRGAFLIDLARIRPDTAQPRREFDEQELENLTQSVRDRGVRQPIRVWYVANENVYQIIAGERRYRASMRAELVQIPCIVEDAPASQPVPPRVDILIEQISENWQRADLKPIEISDALAELREALGIGPRELAKRLSKPESEVSRLLSLQKIDPKIRDDIATDTDAGFTRRHLIALAQLPPAQQATAAAEVRERKLTAVETEREIAKLRGDPKAKTGSPRRGTVRRFAIGAAIIEVRFRKTGVSDTDVLDALERACRLIREQADKEA